MFRREAGARGNQQICFSLAWCHLPLAGLLLGDFAANHHE